MLVNLAIGDVISCCASVRLDFGACGEVEDGLKSPFELYDVSAKGLMQELARECLLSN